MFEQIPSESGVYAIVNTQTGHRYVGGSKDMRKSIRGHVMKLEARAYSKSGMRLLQGAWDEFGPKSFEAVVLEAVPDNRGATDYHVRPDNLSLAKQYHYRRSRGVQHGQAYRST